MSRRTGFIPPQKPAAVENTQFQAYQAAQAVLHASELAIARGRPDSKPASSKRWAWLTERSIPLELVMRASQPSVHAFFSWLGLVLLCIALVYGLVKPSGWIAERDFNAWLQVGIAFLTLCFVLSRPSKHGFSGWQEADLLSAMKRCTALSETRESDLEAVQFFVDYAVEGTRRRITALRWLTGALWAIAVYLAQKGLEAKDGGMFGYAVFPSILALCSAGLIAAYARSIGSVHGLARALLFERRSKIKAQDQMSEARGRRNRRHNKVA